MDGFKLVLTAAKILSQFGSTQYTPDTQGSTGPQPGTAAGGSLGNGSDGSDPCSQPRAARYNYQPLIDGAPTGAVALMCPSDLKPPNSRGSRKGTWEPPGYVSSVDKNNVPVFNRSHIVGDRFNGDWVKENIFTGFKQMNDPVMKRCENKMAQQLKEGKRVLYSGQLEYGNGRNNIPTAIRMTASTPNGLLFDLDISNMPGKVNSC
ncbi:DNA/RNA non-specific endonuclease [Streptomyces xanthochromogenes]|uniref:DNA/RNA non-specific endonuclease n=1 Tax=Streptomyces xanthochromogenes TaxID=67384 RepID=UPI003F4D2429